MPGRDTHRGDGLDVLRGFLDVIPGWLSGTVAIAVTGFRTVEDLGERDHHLRKREGQRPVKSGVFPNYA